ncbi:hypothetical protein [Neorhodopirellula pilleata]|uniref:Uncharacterized protein n=1 Tax=Neorhodopirellula pilleata TaxID=2714738 RepID=A0A5C6AH97_9BACT|nr:hypothetical protein [Neorhodopirellula pilleata]TWT98817.1 hypothetical protein Pla100_19830 [Neorhodopirellula pilleata]
MPTMTCHWRHEAFSRDAGIRTNEDAARTNVDSARTGILTDEHQEVMNGRPVLVEDATGRVYQSADLPPDTRVVVARVGDPPPPLFENARRAGFDIVAAD